MSPTLSRTDGFTLVEALVATLLMGIILAALGSVTSQWLPSWNRGFTGLQRNRLLATELDRLTEDLAAAQFISMDPDNHSPLFNGNNSSVTFVRTTLAANIDAGLQVVQIRQTTDEDRPALVRSTARLLLGTGQAAGVDAFDFADPVVVIRSPYLVSFSYAGLDRLWRNSWQNQPKLPHAIRVQVWDNISSAPLAATTSTLIYTELPANCTWTGMAAHCLITAQN